MSAFCQCNLWEKLDGLVIFIVWYFEAIAIFLSYIDVFFFLTLCFHFCLPVSLQLFYPDRRTRAVEVSENKWCLSILSPQMLLLCSQLTHTSCICVLLNSQQKICWVFSLYCTVASRNLYQHEHVATPSFCCKVPEFLAFVFTWCVPHSCLRIDFVAFSPCAMGLGKVWGR